MPATANASPVTLSHIVSARLRIEGSVGNFSCRESKALSALCGCTVFTKREYLQQTGSFKERGACNALMQLSPAQRATGVIAASAGNHALAMSYHGQRLHIPVTVVMPTFAPLIKQTRCLQLGAEVILRGADIGEAKDYADTLVRSKGYTYIHGFDGLEVIAGQGTVGLEIIEQVPDLDAIICPVGGGGLIAGLSLAVKETKPHIKVIGVEPEHAPSFALSLAAGKPVRAEMKPTLADGLAVPQVGDNAFAVAQSRVDELVLVSEEEIALAILRLVELEKGVVEGAGATPLAALLSGKLNHLKGQRVALVLCGGNIDPAVLGRVIEHGLVVDGRLARFTVQISDRPGGLQEFAAAVASTGASIKQVEHERAFAVVDISRVHVRATVEVRDHAHIQHLYAALEARGMQVIVAGRSVS
jgi:threonine dehydratase